ncbi:NAD-dependent protein deacetylase sirtuin-2-like [Anabrus simplex]|uniref:NAD-dependent protein deacetylase sirtuin-2-like n=1 Tax=Anabrus simplex TaxID=316456 RepID=UPI0035A3B3D8
MASAVKNDIISKSSESSDETKSDSSVTSKEIGNTVACSTEETRKINTKVLITNFKEGKYKHILIMAGAGISTSCGIPDFRSPGSGIYYNLEKYNLPYPQCIFEIEFFRKNPQPFFDLVKQLLPGTFKPTVSHYFIKLLHQKGILLRHYTQNIDGLERVAGLPPNKIIEAHGTIFTSHCLCCGKEYSLEWIKEQIFSDIIPTCTRCNGTVKPDIIFFGESLPDIFFENILSDFSKCDLLIILGSSLSVEPFASLVHQVREECPRLFVNRERVDSGIDFDADDNHRDVELLGECDSVCLYLASQLGWEDDLKKLIDQI